MGKNSKSKTDDRRARIAEMRRAEQARERRNRLLTVIGVTVIVAAILLGGGYLWWSEEQEKKEEAEPAVEGVETWDDLSRDHVTDKVDYPMSPPAGGPHNPAWLDCDAKVYTEPVENEQAVHGLEHGAVWITYTDAVSDQAVQKLTTLVEKTPYTFLSPHQDQESPITLTAWGLQLGVDRPGDPRVAEFLTEYVQGPQTPEPGATCSVEGSM